MSQNCHFDYPTQTLYFIIPRDIIFISVITYYTMNVISADLNLLLNVANLFFCFKYTD